MGFNEKNTQERTYFGYFSTFFKPTYFGGRLDCVKNYDALVRDALSTRFVLDSIDGQQYVPPTDSAIKSTNYGYSNAFQMATVYCAENSVLLMPNNAGFDAFGIPGAILGIFPILFSFFL